MDNRNPILLGKAEEIDPIRPDVRRMLENPGIYIGGDTKIEMLIIPLWSKNGKVHSLIIDKEMDPARFIDTLTLRGPYIPNSLTDSTDNTVVCQDLRGKLEIATRLYARARNITTDEATDNINDAFLNRRDAINPERS